MGMVGAWEVQYIMGLELAILAWCWNMYCRMFFLARDWKHGTLQTDTNYAILSIRGQNLPWLARK
jgi:hypothetical protein